jgi:hypothetical protein
MTLLQIKHGSTHTLELLLSMVVVVVGGGGYVFNHYDYINLTSVVQ